jgi:hypothetical protein
MGIEGLEWIMLALWAASQVRATPLQGGDLSLTVDDSGQVTGLAVGGTDLLDGAKPAPLVSLCDVTAGETFVPGKPTGGNLADGWTLDFPGVQATATARAEPFGEALRFTCRLQGAAGLPARGMLLRFAFPVAAQGWQWHDDMQTAREIGRSGVFENVAALRAWADLPEWADQPALRMGYANRNFCTVLTGPVGLCLAVPLDSPCLFRTAYDAGAQQLQMVYDFALSPDTREPHTAAFSFVLYASDPAWGFRSALERYYRLFPEMFAVHVKDPGMWMAFTPLSQIDNANEFCFGLQEGAPEPEYDDRIGVLDCTYFTHAGMGANIPNHDPEKDPLPPYDVQVEAVEAAFRSSTGMEGLFHQVGLYNAEGKLDVQPWSVYAHLIAQFNLDPDLPYGRWLLERTDRQTESIRKNRGGELDGFYYDGLTGGLNYRTDHFRTSTAPPLWDPVAKKPLLYNFFSACEFARAAAEHLRPRGQITMMNGAVGASCYVAPWLDVLGEETGLRISREELNYIRSVTYHKPFLTLLKGNYEQQIGKAEMELYMKRALAYGILPGFFDWPPSGLGPGGQYWNHPEYYERDRDLFRKYLPLCRTLAKAGWEPVTHARSSNPRVFVERFGRGEEGLVWLTLLNEEARPQTTRLTVDPPGLGLDPRSLQALEILTRRPVRFEEQEGRLAANLEIEADGVSLLQLAPPPQAAAWQLEQARDTVERGRVMRQVDAAKPPVAVHWLPEGENYRREAYGDGFCLVLDGADRGRQRAWQWAMLFQPRPAPVTLRVRAAGEDLAGEGRLGVACQLAWVTPSYSHYEDRFFELPKGSYGFQDFEFTLACDHPLRAIRVGPERGDHVTGRLKIASLTLADGFADDYVVDPHFDQWYEPVPEAMRERLEAASQELREALEEARTAVLRDRSAPATRDLLLEVGGKLTRLREWIRAERAENGCRRVLRDLETAEQHLGMALLGSLGADPPAIAGPLRAAPGDEVLLRFTAPSAPGLPVAAEWRADGEASVEAGPAEVRVQIPRQARVGSRLTVTGQVRIGPPGRAVDLPVVHGIEVVPPLELALLPQGADAETGILRLRAQVRNNRRRPLTVQVGLSLPEGWEAEGKEALNLPAGSQADLELRLLPRGQAAAGSVEIAAVARAGDDRAQASTVLLYIPPEANLLRNPGFEEGTAGWSGFSETTGVDVEVSRSGAASVRMHNANAAVQSQLSQTLFLNQEQPDPILVRAASRAENVSGRPDSGYSLYVDIYYTDGTPLYGQTFNFATGTTDWQWGELCIEPAKPIRNVNVYLLLRSKSGTAWFDDVAVMEDPRRKGNFARQAQVVVDSCFPGYDAKPINDGIAYPPPTVHWTAEAWASAEEERDHFIELRFPEARPIGRVAIYWSLDAGIPRTSAEVQVQVPAGQGWRTVATARPTEPVPMTVLPLETPVTVAALRLFQPAGQGPAGRPNLLWVREVELFPEPFPAPQGPGGGAVRGRAGL